MTTISGKEQTQSEFGSFVYIIFFFLSKEITETEKEENQENSSAENFTVSLVYYSLRQS